MRKVTAAGLDFAPDDERRRRCVIKVMHEAPENLADALVEEWGAKTAEEAYTILSQPDIQVTNKSDKDGQLPKLKKLNEFAKRVIADEHEVGA